MVEQHLLEFEPELQTEAFFKLMAISALWVKRNPPNWTLCWWQSREAPRLQWHRTP